MQNYQCKLSIFLAICFALITFFGCESTSGFQPGIDEIGFKGEGTFKQAHDSKLSSEERGEMQKVAEQLAVRFVNKRSSGKTEIPPKVVSFFYNGLVYLDISDAEEAETVTDQNTLLAADPADPREVLLWVDKSEPWLGRWRAGKTKTGVSEIDNLIEEFDLELAQYRELDARSLGAVGTMRSDSPINGYAVGNKFAVLSQIDKAAPDEAITGGRDVIAQIKADHLLLDVKVGSGDCPSGCINKIEHTFKIYADGEVKVVN
jgi:hypothetical protein